MKMAKDVMLVSAGMLGVLAYQRYGKKLTDKAVKAMDEVADAACNTGKKTRTKND